MEKRKGYWQRVKEHAAALKGDGCSGSPDFFYRRCCDEHDIAYRTGKTVCGKPITRAEADKALFQCMRKTGKTPITGRIILPSIYWLAVRIFGHGPWKGES